ncbi:MAG: oligopeptide/dipeptide ABC transporter ATP-binding protein [Lachnospiraceae bacterium]
MKQRVVIAIALACSPQLLIADEPTTALDVTIQAQVLELMKQLIREKEMAMLLITHDLGVVAEVCEDVAVMYAGRIVEKGTADDVFNHMCHPYTEGLFDSLPNLKQRGGTGSIKGLMPDPSDLAAGMCIRTQMSLCNGALFPGSSGVKGSWQQQYPFCSLQCL